MNTNVKIVQLSNCKSLAPVDLMTLKQIGEKYNFKYHHLRNIIKRDNKIPYYNTGVIMVSETDFINWLNSCYVEKKREV